MNNKNYSENVIPKDVAQQLCKEVRQQFSGKWYTLAGMQCWGCTTYSKDDPTKMCFSNHPGYRGCNLVNARFDRKLPSQNKKMVAG